MERHSLASTTTYHEKPRRRPAEVWQADRMSHRARMAGSAHARKLRAWWNAATPMERIIRVWWWCICAVLGVGLGLIVSVLAIVLFVVSFGA